jgi:hypothetical protein
MAVRLQGEFRTLKDDQYKVQIIDADYSGVVHDITLNGDGFTLTHDGETDAVYSPIVGSSVNVMMYNNSAAVDSFKIDLLNAQDKRFSIRILKYTKPAEEEIANDYRNRVLGDGGTYEAGNCVNDALLALGVGTETRSDIWTDYFKDRVETDGGTFEAASCCTDAIDALGGTTDIPADLFSLYWVGYITQDLVEEADESKPRQIGIKAADGISLLSTLEYNFGLATANSKTFKDALIEMLTDAGIADLFDTDEPILTSVVNWYAEEMTYSATMDPLDNMRTDLKAYSYWSEGNTRTYEISLNIIREMASILGARFYFSEGTYRFEQIAERDELNIREFKYLKSGTEDSVTTSVLDVNVDQDLVYRSQGMFRYLPAVKKVKLKQQKVSAANLIGGSVTFPADELDIGIIPAADNARIYLNMRSVFQTYIATPTSGVATPVFAVTIRLEPTDGSADYYWKNSLVSGATSFGQGSWSTTLGTYKWAANNVSRQASSTTATVHTMATGPLPEDGELYVDITILGFYDSAGSSTSFFIGGNSYSWSVDLQTARFENDNNSAAVVESTFTALNSSPNLGSSLEVHMPDTRLGDGPGSLGSLLVNTGSTYTPSTGWRVGNSGTYIDIAKLATGEVLSLQNKVVNRFEGVFIGGGVFHKRLRFDGAYWLPMRSTLTANADEISVEAFKIAKYTPFVDITIDPSDTRDLEIDTISDFNGTYINASNGVLGGMSVDFAGKTLGPYKEKVDGSAQITQDLQIDGDATSPSLQLTGGSGAQGLMQFNTDEDTVSLVMNGTTHYIGQDVVYNVKNQSGATIPKGRAVRAVGTVGSSGRILIDLMDATGDVPARFYLGVTTEEIANGEDGKVIEFGKINQIDTSAYAAGDVLWLDPANDGKFTTTEPSAPNLKIATAFVINVSATVGVIMVRANQGYRLEDLHDVNITSPAEGDILRWDNDLKYWYNTPFPG